MADEVWFSSAAPEERARAAAEAIGYEAFTEWCGLILAGDLSFGDILATGDPDPRWLAGPRWTSWGDPHTWPGRGLEYWMSVWAARSLLHVWNPAAAPAVTRGLGHAHWRVREMCAKIVAQYELGENAGACQRLAVGDGNARVRAAAVRALGIVGEAEHASTIAAARQDPDASVVLAAHRAAVSLESRLDRRFEDLFE